MAAGCILLTAGVRFHSVRGSGVHRIFFRGGSTNSVEDREQGSGGGSPLPGVLEAAVIWYKKFHFI
jgi:hypothetical protein